MRTARMFSIVSFVTAMAMAGAAIGEAPIPTGQTPTLYGGQRLDPKTFVIGATTGYPETSFDVYWGFTNVFDLGLQLGFTYGPRLDGDRQRLGMDFHVPLRFTLLQRNIVSGGLRVSPYLMIGESAPAVETGVDVGFLVDIALPKIFKIIVGPELRTGFASVGNINRINGYDGGTWVIAGIETLLAGRFHVGGVMHGGAQWGTGGLGVDGVFRFQICFGVLM